MKNCYSIFILLILISLNKAISQNKNTTSHKNKKIEKPIFIGVDIENKIPPNTISLKVAIVSDTKTKENCTQKNDFMVAVKILEITGNGQGIIPTFNKNKTEEFIVPVYLKEKIKNGKNFKLYVTQELCTDTLENSYKITKLLNKLN